MKQIISILLSVILSIGAVMAASPDNDRIEWNQTQHDFGTIHASGGKVKAEYTFVNTSSEPVAIISVTNGGCGCTVPSFPKKPVAANEKGTITITFDPSRFKGEFKRQVTVTLMVGNKREKTRLRFSGSIIPD